MTTHGVVTAEGFRTLWVQDPNGDDNDATSDGIQVSWTSGQNSFWSAFDVGDCIEFEGVVSEFIPGGVGTGNLSTTNFFFFAPTTAATVNCGSTFGPGYSFPAPTIIGESGRVAPNEITISDNELPVNLQDEPGVFNPDVDGIDFYESMEGMLVTIEDAVAVSATRRFSTFSAEFFTLPNQGSKTIIEPDDARTDRGGIQIQADPDGYGDLNPERIQVQLSGSPLYPGDMDLQVKVGDLVGDVTGPLGYSFGNFEVNATNEIVVTDGGNSEETTDINPKENWVTVASYNVLNLSVGDVFDDEGPDDVAQFAELGEHISNNLKAPDVVALQEIQDDSGVANDGTVTADATLAELAQSIIDAGGPSYEAFNVNPIDGTQGGAPGGNIRNAFLYNPDRVNLLGFTALTSDLLEAAGCDDDGDPCSPDAFAGTRIPLVGLFDFNGARFTVISVHNSSRFGSTPIFGGPQPFVQAAEAEREAQSKALNAYADFLVNGDSGAQVIVAGDMNTFEFTDELTEDLAGPEPRLENLVVLDKKDAGDNYSFIFDGNSQMLDHIFATSNIAKSAKFDTVHMNVDFPRTFINVTGSDHEPLLAQFKLKAQKNTA